jgi:hypothetical protein
VDELDNYVDIDDYYRRIGLPTGDHDVAELRHAVGEEIEGASQQLSGSIGGQRRYTWARASPADVKTIKRELGGRMKCGVVIKRQRRCHHRRIRSGGRQSGRHCPRTQPAHGDQHKHRPSTRSRWGIDTK